MLTIVLCDLSEGSEGRCKPTAVFKVRVDNIRQNFELQNSFFKLDIDFSERKKKAYSSQ